MSTIQNPRKGLRIPRYYHALTDFPVRVGKGTQMAMNNDDELDEDIREAVICHQRDGISYEVDWEGEIEGDEDLKVIGIHWRPGEHNQLAQSIIKEVHERMMLEIDGHRYWIEPR
jgi:hypothetical protein